MNTELLLRVKAHILEEPRRLLMSQWKVKAAPGERAWAGWDTGKNGPVLEFDAETAPPCGTAGCIAGWATILSGVDESNSEIESIARELLEINSSVARNLFRVDMWPMAEKKAYLRARTAKSRARIVANRIDDFIKENE